MLTKIQEMHAKFNTYEAVNNMDKETLLSFLKFRKDCIQEEVDELADAISKFEKSKSLKHADLIIDSTIDAIVFSLGLLDLLQVDTATAWDKVMNANLNKEVGIKVGRSNPFGLPDLIKPEGWQSPCHHADVPNTLLSKLM